MNDAIAIFCDGLCEPQNPGGRACWAWLARSPRGKVLRGGYGCLGVGPGMTNNLAEYHAVLNALRYTITRLDLLIEKRLSVAVYSDSQLVIRQINRAYACNKLELAALRDEVYALVEQAGAAGVRISFDWIPREQNTEADALSRRAYQEARAADPKLAPGEYAIPATAAPEQCRSCGAAIVWAKTAGGKAIPLSLALAEERGGKRITKPHFVDCPESRQWKRS